MEGLRRIKVYTLDKTTKEVIQKRISKALKKREEIIFAYLHGSFLEERFRDVDVAIYLSTKKNELYALNLERELEDEVGFPVDVRILNNAPLSFKFRVIEQGFLLFSKDEKRRCEFESLTMEEYHDFSFHREIYRRVALGIKV